VELGAEAVARACAAGAEAGLNGSVSFAAGDASRLPLPDASVDAVLCECSLCLFEDKRGVVGEMTRVLRPRGRVVIADVTVRAGGLPAPLQSVAGRIACVADALSLDGYERLLRDAGLEVEVREQHREAVARMVDRIEARLRAARIIRVPVLEPFRAELDTAIELARATKRAIADDIVGYALIAACRPG
ncbi:MAG: methyltransferase domain-containing protein, partial [Actinomycetota bacterium]|nr:methyltransferase domain-containing protein [Actinomycetota bacterium]